MVSVKVRVSMHQKGFSIHFPQTNLVKACLVSNCLVSYLYPGAARLSHKFKLKRHCSQSANEYREAASQVNFQSSVLQLVVIGEQLKSGRVNKLDAAQLLDSTLRSYFW